LNTISDTACDEIEVMNPSTGEKLYTIAEASDAAIAEAYRGAREAYGVISAMSVAERVAEVAKLRRYIVEHKEGIIDAIAAETGKSRTDALISEIFNTVDAVDYYIRNAEKILAPQKVATPIILYPKKSRIFYEPMGPVLIISPWNYPFNLTVIPFVCAFLAGNAVVFKPSEWTPLKGLLEEMTQKSGFIDGALQVIYGGKQTGKRLIDGRPAKVFFTGSCRGGREVMKQGAEHLIPVELELGGKDPCIVFDDVDLERTVNGVIWGGMTNAGQTCTSVERIVVHENICDAFTKTLTEKIERVRFPSEKDDDGDPHALDIGSLTTPFQVEKIQELIDDAVAKGAKVITGGNRVGKSLAFEPTVLTGVTSEMRIVREETFGPVMTIQPFRSEDEALAMANDSPFGLSGSVWSADLDRGERVARQVEAGTVSVNNVLATQANPALPFGGVKESGFGRYKGPFGLYSFSNVKSVVIDRQGSHMELNWYPYSMEKYQLFSKLIDALYAGGPLKLLKAINIGVKLQGLSKKNRL
jgi:acyl-CoA reductase-like NAD-dependent aldehyde dehydrogenase